jgi:hypothetical protein
MKGRDRTWHNLRPRTRDHHGAVFLRIKGSGVGVKVCSHTRRFHKLRGHVSGAAIGGCRAAEAVGRCNGDDGCAGVCTSTR